MSKWIIADAELFQGYKIDIKYPNGVNIFKKNKIIILPEVNAFYFEKYEALIFNVLDIPYNINFLIKDTNANNYEDIEFIIGKYFDAEMCEVNYLPDNIELK